MRTRTYGVACPQDAAHGPLLDWPGERTAFYCPHRAHRGHWFYTTDLLPVARTAPQLTTATLTPASPRTGASRHPASDSPSRPSSDPATADAGAAGDLDEAPDAGIGQQPSESVAGASTPPPQAARPPRRLGATSHVPGL